MCGVVWNRQTHTHRRGGSAATVVVPCLSFSFLSHSFFHSRGGGSSLETQPNEDRPWGKGWGFILPFLPTISSTRGKGEGNGNRTNATGSAGASHHDRDRWRDGHHDRMSSIKKEDAREKQTKNHAPNRWETGVETPPHPSLGGQTT